MKSETSNPKRALRLSVPVALFLVAAATPSLCFAAGPGGMARGFGAVVNHILEGSQAGKPFAGVSDPISFSPADNINTRGFALRRDGAY